MDPSLSNINLKAAISDLEQGRIDPELLRIKVKPAKDPVDYAVNNHNKKIRMLVGAKAGDVIWHFQMTKRTAVFQ
jgi:hypothetical protein